MDISQNEMLRDKDFRLSGVLRRMGEAKQRKRTPNNEDVATNVVDKEDLDATARRDATGPSSADRWPLPGLAPMTRVSTSFGDVHAVALRKGDLVETRDGDFRPIVWLNRVLLDEQFLQQKPDSNPVEIRAGAVAQGVPRADIMVSPRQIICAAAGASKAEAAGLSSKPGISRRFETGLSYTMFHLGAPADVMCEGVYLRFAPETSSA